MCMLPCHGRARKQKKQSNRAMAGQQRKIKSSAVPEANTEHSEDPEAATEHSEKRAATEHSENDGWLPYGKEYAVDPNREVTGFYMPDKELASAEQIKDDTDAWKTSFARDQRANFVQNHDHDCTGTCVKYQKKKNATEPLQRAGQKIAGPGVPKCRFRFFRYAALQIEGDA